jgi:hypothetical protein
LNFFLLKIIFFNVFELFWCANDVKNDFFFLKKMLFWCIYERKSLWNATFIILLNKH